FYVLNLLFSLFFFFQAEDGIRDLTVTGVQTCALPISWPSLLGNTEKSPWSTRRIVFPFFSTSSNVMPSFSVTRARLGFDVSKTRSEERRVGKACRYWRSP